MLSRHMKSLLILPVLVICSFQTACVTRGRDFSSDLSWIRKGQTTQADVTRLLGEPVSTGNTGGVPTWTYQYGNYRAFGETDTKELKFYWTGDKVQDFSFNSSFPQDRKRMMLGK